MPHNLLGLELVVVLGVAVLVCELAGRRLGVAPPVLLLVVGALLGFVPTLREAHLPPEAVLLLFLPVLLYGESLTTSLREIRSNLRVIVLMSTLLVLATAVVVASVGHALGLPWGPAWVLGAALAPTDATAVGVLARRLPRRTVTVLRAESLINDGTALVIYGIAVGVTVGAEHLTVPYLGWLFLLAYLGGAAAGAVTAWLGVMVRRRMDDPLLESVAVVLLPFTAFLGAEAIDASGVLAVVVCGLIMSQSGPRVGLPDTRQQIRASWTLAAYLLNGSLFVLVGLEAQSALRGLTTFDVTRALVMVGIASATVVAVRFAFLFLFTYLIRAIDRRPQQRRRRVGHRARVISGVAGFRGAVSLAAALAVPHTLDSGAAFPDRDIIVFVTCGVIVVTLVGQGLLLPAVVRWARLPRDTSVDEERQLAQTAATEEALAALDDVAAELGTDPDVVRRLRDEYETHLLVTRAYQEGTGQEPALRHAEHYTALRLALLARKRATVLRLRDEQHIDDTVLRQLQSALDIEEVRLARRQSPPGPTSA
ncbi:Na+/H+ antiporter [Streptomyces hainanensis]|uniref:Na+/H+ antiporter n=1 Tax=Streptomyces hainanensis TaxID=402648 RepID=A0A4R4TLU8_9ACTN|nr:Na+/H+ antiporter [Streptomyces hainanensis]TDC75049.1 Na+/H+ antiporter [Streptomyces hainanensis]